MHMFLAESVARWQTGHIFICSSLSPHAGPVRHFMELVVTGLSKNPYYTAKEKQEFVEWYRNYFSQFTPEELQAIATNKMEPTAETQQ